MSKLDIVVFGATGYTGKFVVRELALISEREKLKWAIAGRSKQKLDQVLLSLSTELGIDLSMIETIIVDINDELSITSMCQRTRLLINCVGPYRFYGEQVVQKCIENKTHHLDVSGEPEYLERIQLKFHEKALENGVFIIGSCGFDSVPADIGVLYTQENFKYDLNGVESFLTFDFAGKPVSFNYATWESAVFGFASSKHLGAIRRQLFTIPLPKPKYKLPVKTNKFGFFYDNDLKKYCMDFMGSDKSVVQRTQYFNFNILNQRPIQYRPYFTIGSRFYTFVTILWGLSFSFLANFKFGRSLLLKFYKFFSFGLASKKETTIDQMEGISFKMLFKGVGFGKKFENKDSEPDHQPDKVIITELKGKEPGYVSTSKIILNCAIVLLSELDKIKINGGVLTPGAAFRYTSLIDRLKSDGFDFKIIRNDSIAKSNL